MDITLEPVTHDQRLVLWKLMQLCIHDYSEFEPIEIGSNGDFENRWFASYFEAPGRYAYFVKIGKDRNFGGFVLIREKVNEVEGENWDYQIAEFFILRNYRRKGVGKLVAQQAIQLFKGRWEISYSERNLPAKSFWASVATGFPGVRQETGCGEAEDRSRYWIET